MEIAPCPAGVSLRSALRFAQNDTRFFKLSHYRESRALDCASLHALQLLPDSQNLVRHSREGVGRFRSRLEHGRISRDDRPLLRYEHFKINQHTSTIGGCE